MRYRILVAIVIVVGLAARSGDALSQQKSPKEQLLGVWHLVSIDYVPGDGSKYTTFGDSPKGIAFFDSTGHYIITVMRSDRAKYATNDRTQGTDAENRATAQGTITYFGSFTVGEADRTISIQVVGSSFPNWNGASQKRLFTITGDELKLTNPVASIGQGTTEVVFKRAR